MSTDESRQDSEVLPFGEVLDRVLEGDAEAREELFTRVASQHREGALLVSLARRLMPRGDRVRDLVETRDVVQSALRSGWLNFDEFRGHTPAEFVGWIRTILRRKVSKAIANVRQLRDDPDRAKKLHERLSAELPLASLIRDEARNRVRRAVDELPEAQREVIQLRIEGLSSLEIAERLGLEPATVRKRESRALARLRGILELYGLGRT